MNKNILTTILVILVILISFAIFKMSPLGDRVDTNILKDDEIGTSTSTLIATTSKQTKVITTADLLSGNAGGLKVNVVSTSSSFAKKTSDGRGFLKGIVTLDSKPYVTTVNIYAKGIETPYMTIQNIFEDGEFRVDLRVGEYTITPVGKGNVNCETKSVNVTKDSHTTLTFKCN